MSKVLRLFHTVKYLKIRQLYWRIFYIIRRKVFKYSPAVALRANAGANGTALSLKESISSNVSWDGEKSFTFLNQTHQFAENIDWDLIDYGKLWTYNLNYFDFLNQKQIDKEKGLELINDFIKNGTLLKDGKEPYPISLRGINWIKFLSVNNINEQHIEQYLYNDYQNLLHNIEYHLLGNHLLENGFSLFFGAYYFKDEILYEKANKILTTELKEQILDDGAHYELSPMYHQILLHRLLDCVQLIQLNTWKDREMLSLFMEKATKMLSWLRRVTYNNGSIPMLNDSTYDIAPSSKELFTYATNIGLEIKEGKLSDSGYRVTKSKDYEFFVDVGEIGPKYQAGHAHADTLSFELYVKNNPIIVDVGVSTYEKNDVRQKERGTESHNTVVVGKQNQSQVWGGFRVANRAKIIKLVEKDNYIEATHDGYRKLGVLHTRKISFDKTKINIKDIISKDTNLEQVSSFHFHPTIENIALTGKKVKLIDESITFSFINSKKIELVKYKYAIGFNKTVSAYKLKVYFSKSLETIIRL